MCDKGCGKYKKRGLSASVDGKGIRVAATASPGTVIHTAIASKAANEWDELYLKAVNTSVSAVKLTLQWGGTVDPDDSVEITIPPETGLIEVIPGHLIQNSAIVRAFAATANVIVVHGYVNRYENTN